MLTYNINPLQFVINVARFIFSVISETSFLFSIPKILTPRNKTICEIIKYLQKISIQNRLTGYEYDNEYDE